LKSLQIKLKLSKKVKWILKNKGKDQDKNNVKIKIRKLTLIIHKEKPIKIILNKKNIFRLRTHNSN